MKYKYALALAAIFFSLLVSAQVMESIGSAQRVELRYGLLRGIKSMGELKMTSTLLIGYEQRTTNRDFYLL